MSLRSRPAKESFTSSSSSSEQLNTFSAPAPELRPKPLGLVFLVALAAASAYSFLAVPLTAKTALFTFAWAILGSFSDSAGYHRLWAHRSYEAAFPLKLFFALFGAANFTGSILSWARNHRAHHRQVDTPNDPFNRKKGFFYAFLGHHFVDKSIIGDANVADLQKESLVVFQDRLYFLIAPLFGWVLPAVIASNWNDAMGGFFYAGITRSFLFILIQSFLWALGRTFGRRPYNPTHSARNNVLVSILTLGDGYLNFHYEFPSDYRIGCFYYHLDATKWILRFFSVLGLASKFNKTPYDQILRVRVQKKQADLDRIRDKVTFGPDPDTLPVWTMETFEKRVAAGEPLLIIDNIIHNLKDFFAEHPGGEEVLKPKIGKDATIAFNGGVQRHSKAARNLAAFMRVAILDKKSRQNDDDAEKKE